MPTKMLDLVMHNPPATLFSPAAQMLVAGGIGIFFICWGLAKVIRAFREER